MGTVPVDRTALVRRAIVEWLAETGIHGASMSKEAERALRSTSRPFP